MAAVLFPSLPAELTPTAKQVLTSGNYIDFTNASFEQWAQQYMPDTYAAEVERYGNRSVASLLRMVSAEIPIESDQAIWSEQGRLHLSYEDVTCGLDTAGQNTLTLASGTHAVRKGQTILITDGTNELRARVDEGVETSDTAILVTCYTDATGLVNAGLSTVADDCKFFVFGSEYGKGSSGIGEAVTPEPHIFSNTLKIMRDEFAVSGSDMAQIGWIEVTGEAGQSGYLWYMKAEGETRTRFEDYLEMDSIESVTATHAGVGVGGSEGFFDSLENRGIVADGAFDSSADVITDFEEVLKQLDKQGGIEENALFLGRGASITMDTGLASQNSYGAGGTSYGLFNNSEDMALNLGFTGFRRGGYDFYKTDWKYLNDASTRGGFGSIDGVLVPAGTTSVYDQQLGKNIRRPFLHVRYRANQVVNRKMKSWVVGSEGGASNTDVDEMRIHYLSERCLVTQAANNFVLFKA